MTTARPNRACSPAPASASRMSVSGCNRAMAMPPGSAPGRVTAAASPWSSRSTGRPMPPDEVLRVVLVDDEPPALDRLRDAVGTIPGFSVVAEARDGGEAVATIAAAAPHIAIVDIEMPGMNGLDVVRNLDPDVMPVVIFATAYDHHAISAFEVGASDFVLKPIDYDRLHAALRRARVICDSGGRGEATAALLRQIDTLKSQLGGNDDDHWLRDIWVQKRSEFRRIDVRDIDWLQSERVFVCFFSCGESYLLREK